MMRNDHKNFAVEQELSCAAAKARGMGLNVERCGDWLWLPKHSTVAKTKLRKLGFCYSPQNKSWIYKPKSMKFSKQENSVLSLDEIRGHYGGHIMDSNAIHATFNRKGNTSISTFDADDEMVVNEKNSFSFLSLSKWIFNRLFRLTRYTIRCAGIIVFGALSIGLR
jgi:hypothetical protein